MSTPDFRRRELTITLWLPIVTFCPVNKLPDLWFVSITFRAFVELYAVRRALRRFNGRTMFMEDVAEAVSVLYPEARRIEVRLMFNKHRVLVEHW